MGDDGAMPEPASARQVGDGSQYLGAGSLERLLRSFTEDGQLLLLAIRPNGQIVWTTSTVTYVLGYEPAEVLGKNVLDMLHPDDVDRAADQLGQGREAGIVPGITRFLVTHADGSWMPVEILASYMTDGAEDVVGVYVRKGLHDVLQEEILATLLTGAPRADVLAPVTNSIQWEEAGSHLAISWCDETGFNQVSTALPDALGGGDGEPGTPWGVARAHRTPKQGTRDDLDDQRRAMAEELKVDPYWIEPVEWAENWPPALITIWTVGGPRAPIVHAYGMAIARNLVQLILRWTEQAQRLDRAARFDDLTGLANRRAFFDALDGTTTGGAVLYCDLDRFKPVNDQFGHSIGDQVLRLAGMRIKACVREHDVVGRLGGDEFGVLCEGSTETEAVDIAERIRASLSDPFSFESVEVRISVSVGVAINPDELSERVLDAADQALVLAKAGTRAGGLDDPDLRR